MNATPKDAEPVGREILVAANADAAEYYRTQLLAPEHTGPRDYLTARGFADLLGETVWTVGYAPTGWTNLVDHLSALGYSETTVLQAGLATRSRRGTLIDRFRNRLTFGIHNHHDELVGFTARCSPGADDAVPKYLNTPTSALYHKGEVLFGLAEHADRLRSGATLVLVEGPLDAIAVAAATTDTAPHGRPAAPGYAPAALCGTALTQTHATQIAKLITGEVIVALDEDAAGQQAAENAYLKLARHTDQLTAPRPRKCNDPADILQAAGTAGLREHLHNADPLGIRILEHHLATWRDLGDNAETDIAALRELARTIAAAQPRDVATLTRALARRLRLPPGTVTRELAEATAQAPDPHATRSRASVSAKRCDRTTGRR